MAARNILVDKGHVCKIADFGLARDIYEKKQYLKTGEVRLLHCQFFFFTSSLYNLKQENRPFIHLFSFVSCPRGSTELLCRSFRYLVDGYFVLLVAHICSIVFPGGITTSLDGDRVDI